MLSLSEALQPLLANFAIISIMVSLWSYISDHLDREPNWVRHLLFGLLCNQHDALYIGVAALLDTLARVEVELAGLDKKVRQITAASKPCWHLMSVPGVGPLTSLAFVATVEDPGRFQTSRSIGSYIGLTPRRYQSGDRDVTGSISKQGDEMLRHYLYEAAGCLLTTVTAPSALRSWGLKLAKRLGPKHARTAVARKLAVLLLGLWKREDHFRAASGGKAS